MKQARAYAIAALLAALSIFLQYWLVRWSNVPALGIFYPAIFLSAFLYGFGPALLSFALIAAMALGSFYRPDLALAGQLAELSRHLVFVATAIGMAWLLDRARRAQDQLRLAKSEAEHARARLDEFFAKAPTPIAVLSGPEFRFELANPQYLALLGRRDSVAGLTVTEALPGLATEIRDILGRVYRTRERFVGQEYPILLDWQGRGSPSLKYLNFIYEPFAGDERDGRDGILVFAYDVTELVLNRKALEESEQQIRAYAEAMPQMAFIADGKGSITYFNARWYEYVGLARGETEGWSWREHPIHHPEDLVATEARWRDAIATGKPYEVQYRLRRHDGEYRWHLGRAMPMRNRDGEVTSWFGTNTDIHEQKLTQEQLARALRGRDDFLAVAAHELRTPVTALLLQAQLRSRQLARQGTAPFNHTRLHEIFLQDQKQAERLARVMDDILDVSQLSRDHLQLRIVTTDLSALAKDIAQRLRPMFDAKSTLLQLEEAETVFANVDAARLERALSNLLLNALKYGAGTPVTLGVTKEGDRVFLRVADRGPGIDPADQQRIFDRFERGQHRADITGLGLGLYITREIAEAHHGSLSLVSVPHQETTFTIEIPGDASARSPSTEAIEQKH